MKYEIIRKKNIGITTFDKLDCGAAFISPFKENEIYIKLNTPVRFKNVPDDCYFNSISLNNGGVAYFGNLSAVLPYYGKILFNEDEFGLPKNCAGAIDTDEI